MSIFRSACAVAYGTNSSISHPEDIDALAEDDDDGENENGKR